MTALKPIDNTEHVTPVLAGKYRRADVCSNPECGEEAGSTHHVFGRPKGKPNNGSYFVLIEKGQKIPTPHGAATCGHGTAGCHGDLEAHRAAIRWEDGVFVWYARDDEEGEEVGDWPGKWRRVGPLDPQPGQLKAAKPPRKNFKGKARRSRKTISVKVPQDAQEDGGAIWDDLLGDGKGDNPYGRVREKLDREFGLDQPTAREGGSRDVYYVLVDVLNDWVDS